MTLDEHVPPPLDIEVAAVGDTVVVRLEGALDLVTAPVLEADAVAGLEHGGRNVIVDCGQLTFIDSTGLRALVIVREAAHARAGRVTLRRAPATLRRLLELTALTSSFIVEPD